MCVALCRKKWNFQERNHHIRYYTYVWAFPAYRPISPKGKVSLSLKRAIGVIREIQCPLFMPCLSTSTMLKEQSRICSKQPDLQSQCWRHNLCFYPVDGAQEHAYQVHCGDVSKMQAILCVLESFPSAASRGGLWIWTSEESPFLIKLLFWHTH